MKYLKLSIIVATLFILASCGDDYLDTTPTDLVSSSAAFQNITNAWAALNGIHRALYVQYANQGEGGEGNLNLNRDVLGEDYVMTAVGNGWFNNAYKWLDHRSETSALSKYPYAVYYRLIGNANLIIANIDAIAADPAEINAIKGQALVYRAWSHFQLVQLYGQRYDKSKAPNTQLGVPLMLTPTSEGQTRAAVEEVYTQVHKDLDDAISFLPATSRKNKSHFNGQVAKGIKASVYLAQQDYPNAAKFAAEARAGFNLMTNADYLSGFNNVSNQEWMWGSDQIDEQTTFFYSYFSYVSCNFNSTNIRTNPKAINSALYKMISDTDVRKKCWDPTGSASAITPPGGLKKPYMTQKFLASSSSNSVGDVPYMRAGEMYLIEAEAKARSNDNSGAQDVLFILAKNRDPNYVKSTKTGTELIEEIMIQRRVELWGEGFRFTDLKRLNLPLNRNGANHQSALCLIFDVPAGDKQWEFLFPRDELNANPQIVQNPL
ncbi:MAG: RagB/SusD family nutrient uptake outer membrane protein [Saprospiraceae bacterium]